MKIHTVKEGETVEKIAEEYGIEAEILRRVNGLSAKARAAVGEELAVIIPTRTYKAKRGDTVARIALRFGIRQREIYRNNPSLLGRELIPGETLILRISEPPTTSAVSCGIIYRGTSDRKINMALPYITYAAVSEAFLGDGKIKWLFDGTPIIRAVERAGKIPLLRITDGGTGAKYRDKAAREEFATELVKSAGERGYKGILLAAYADARGSEDDFAEFLLELRRRMIGEDLILITECDERSPAYISDLADGAIFSYDRRGADIDKSFKDCEGAFSAGFATTSESAKSFLDIPTLALADSGYIPIDEALDFARRRGVKIKTGEESLISTYECDKGTVAFPSLKNIKARLALSAELGFMGISFDILRAPVRYLYTLGACFGGMNYVGLTSREGCSRES